MAALDFPSSPTNGQMYSANGNTWTYDSTTTSWVAASAGGASVTVSATAPSSPVTGDLWWDSTNGVLRVYYADGTSSQWVDASTGGGGGGSGSTSGPAFHAYGATSTSVPINTYTKITFNAEVYDTANCFNTSNSRFTPNVAGYYQFTYNMIMAQIIYTNFFPALWKNGVEHLRGPQINSVYGGGGGGLIYLNGTTDYVEVYLYQAYVDPATAGGGGSAAASQTYFTGFLARPA